MKNFIITITLLFFISTSRCRARIGETYEECVKRYGTPIEKTTDKILTTLPNYLFNKNGICIEVTFSNNRAIAICFFNQDKSPLLSNTFTELLNINVISGEEWRKIDGNGRAWFCLKTKPLTPMRVAYLIHGDQLLNIYDQEYVLLKAEKEKQKTSGF